MTDGQVAADANTSFTGAAVGDGNLSLDRRVAIVTGAARGIGRSEALALAGRGAAIVAVDILDPSPTVEEIIGAGGIAAAVCADLSSPRAADDAFDAALDAFGDLHILVNNAGLIRDRMSFRLTDDDWESVVGVNLSASFYLARGAARYWRACHRNGDRTARAIVNTSSESGLYGSAGQANYSAAKAGVAALTLTLAVELDRYGIRVNAIAPRARTPMTDAAFGELPRDGDFDLFSPAHVGAVVAWLSSDAALEVTGQVLVVHGRTIEVMRGWSVRHSVTWAGDWAGSDSNELTRLLFRGGDSRNLARPIHELFF